MKKIFSLTLAVLLAAGVASCGDANDQKAAQRKEIDTLSYMMGMSFAQKDAITAFLQQQGIDSAYIDEFVRGIDDGLKVASNKKELAYHIGVQQGIQQKLSQFDPMQSQVFADTTMSVNTREFISGFRDGLRGHTRYKLNDVKMGPEAATKYFQDKVKAMYDNAIDKKYGADRKAADAFMKAKAAEPGVKALGAGVYYKVIKEGNGAKAAKGQMASINYKGALKDGKVFDQNPKGQPVDFPVGQGAVIKGFDLALQAMPVGSTWEIYIPYDQGYGKDGASGVIPPFAPLVFTIELLEVKDAPQGSARLGDNAKAQ